MLVLMLMLMLDGRLPLAPAPAFCDEFLRFLIFQFFHTIAIWVPLASPTCGFRASSSAPDGLAVQSSGCRPSPHRRQPVTSNRVALAPLRRCWSKRSRPSSPANWSPRLGPAHIDSPRYGWQLMPSLLCLAASLLVRAVLRQRREDRQ